MFAPETLGQEIEGTEAKKIRGRGRVTAAEEAEELQRMRDGVKRYVKAELGLGHNVCSILTKYVNELETGMKAQ